MSPARSITRRRAGYILQEVIVGVIIFGIAIVPIVRAVSRLPGIGARLGEQGRVEAWRSLVDQVVTAGVDPLQTPVLADLMTPEFLEAAAPSLSRSTLPAAAGANYGAVITGLCDRFPAVAEFRSPGSGFEVGANTTPVPPRQNPLLPLPPRRLPPPVISQPVGPLVQLGELVPAGPGEPYLAHIRAMGTDRVRVRQSAPELRHGEGMGQAEITVTSVQLAHSVRGEAWSEYAGDEAVDTAVTLPDLRVRWIVRMGRQFQVVEPSEPVAFVFGIDIGRPVYWLANGMHLSGSTVPVDLALARAVESGTAEASITYPEAVRAVFGSAWTSVAPAFDWSFGPEAGDSTAGRTNSLYASAFRQRWSNSQALRATPRSPLAGLPLHAGSWTLQRRSTPLSPPERVGSYYDGRTDQPGQVDFQAPVVPSLGARAGRPEVGGLQSTGETLSVTIVP